MKYLLLLSLLLTSLASCSKKDPEPVDPFLGHWQADTVRSVYYDADGQVTKDVTDLLRQDLDVTATTMTITGYQLDGTPRTPSTNGYTHLGEDLVFDRFSSVLVIYHVRSLTSAGFTLQSDHYRALSPGSALTATSYIAFHR